MKSDVGKIIDTICAIEKVQKKELAERLGTTMSNLGTIARSDSKFSTVLNIAELLGYDIVFTKSNGMGSVRVSDGNECERCMYKVFSDNIEDALKKLSVAKGDTGTELDFYKDDGIINKETE